MKRVARRLSSALFAGVIAFGTVTAGLSIAAYATQSTEAIDNKHYEFDEKSKYEIDDATPTGKTANPLGKLSLSGDIKSINAVNGFSAYEVQKDTVSVNFSIQPTFITDDEYQWHIIDDKSKEINGEKIENNILKGTVEVQTSLTGDNWITDVIYTDIAGEESSFSPEIYSSKQIQQVNGCYYRILVVYEIEKRGEDNKIGLIKTKNYETKKCAEEYTWYLIDSSENRAGATSPDTIPKKDLDTKKINTGKDNGFSGDVPIGEKDPHFGWDIGTFFINGYTRETTDPTDPTYNDPVFLKNVGDRVTLWFNLKQNINSLNDNPDLSIKEDKDGYDQYFEVPKTNFKHGTVIIRFTDYQGVKHDPVIYTDYLAACARTGADTKVELFEEGDYEVALDYEVEDKKGIGSSYSDYRLFFKFKIRNGNTQVFPFDISSGSELDNGDLTANGFRLDMAKSRYLTIDVERSVVKENNGGFSKDVRFNRPAKDGDSYTEEGIYELRVDNLYTDSKPTTKTFYVGDKPIYKALSRGYSLAEINAMLAKDGILEDDGTITMPIIEEEAPPVEGETVEELPTVEASTQSETEPPAETSTEESTEAEEPTEAENPHKDGGSGVKVFIVLAVVAICGVVLWKKTTSKKSTDKKNIDENSNEGGNQS